MYHKLSCLKYIPVHMSLRVSNPSLWIFWGFWDRSCTYCTLQLIFLLVFDVIEKGNGNNLHDWTDRHYATARPIPLGWSPIYGTLLPKSEPEQIVRHMIMYSVFCLKLCSTDYFNWAWAGSYLSIQDSFARYIQDSRHKSCVWHMYSCLYMYIYCVEYSHLSKHWCSFRSDVELASAQLQSMLSIKIINSFSSKQWALASRFGCGCCVDSRQCQHRRIARYGDVSWVTSPHHPLAVAILDGDEVFVREGCGQQTAVDFTKVLGTERKSVVPLGSFRVKIFHSSNRSWGSLDVDAAEKVDLVSWKILHAKTRDHTRDENKFFFIVWEKIGAYQLSQLLRQLEAKDWKGGCWASWDVVAATSWAGPEIQMTYRAEK